MMIPTYPWNGREIDEEFERVKGKRVRELERKRGVGMYVCLGARKPKNIRGVEENQKKIK